MSGERVIEGKTDRHAVELVALQPARLLTIQIRDILDLSLQSPSSTLHSTLTYPKLDASCFLLTSATSRALGSKNSNHQEIKKKKSLFLT
jgi:hypothetical protein